MTIDELRQERDETVTAGVDRSGEQRAVAQQNSRLQEWNNTDPQRRSVVLRREPESSDAGGGGELDVATGPFSGGYLGEVDAVSRITFDEDQFLIQDNGSGEVLVTGAGGTVDVQGDAGFVASVTNIFFTTAADPSACFINVIDGGGGTAIVEIPVIPCSPGGVVVLGDDDGATEWFPTDTCDTP
jgi:hypothetical protein